MTERKPLVGHFDAKKHAYRQTQDGVVISFVVDPADITPEFAAAPLGTTLKIGYAEYDPETGQAKEAPKAEKPKKRVRTPSQNCATWCKNPEFQAWIKARYPRAWEEESVMNDVGCDDATTNGIVMAVCGVDSKTELDHDPEKANRWKALHTEFIYRNTPALERG